MGPAERLGEDPHSTGRPADGRLKVGVSLDARAGTISWKLSGVPALPGRAAGEAALSEAPTSYVKSKQRVADHGEVFTPAWMVEAMLDLVKDETQRIDSRFLEPACGSGNFLVPILRRKLAAVEVRYGRSDFERRHYALLAVMCVYGIELLADNIAECRANVLEALAEYLGLEEADDLHRAAAAVLSQNLVHGDALTMLTHDGKPITFAEWGYLGKGRYQRRDFRLDNLTLSSAYSAQGSLFADHSRHELFTPVMEYPPMTVADLVGEPGGEPRPPSPASHCAAAIRTC